MSKGCRHTRPGDHTLVYLKETKNGMRAQIDCEVCKIFKIKDLDHAEAKIIKIILLNE